MLYFPIRRRGGILLYTAPSPVVINPYFVFAVSLRSPLLFLLFLISRGSVLLIWRDFFLVFIFPGVWFWKGILVFGYFPVGKFLINLIW